MYHPRANSSSLFKFHQLLKSPIKIPSNSIQIKTLESFPIFIQIQFWIWGSFYKESCSLFQILQNNILFGIFQVWEDFLLVDSNSGQLKIGLNKENWYCSFRAEPTPVAHAGLQPPTLGSRSLASFPSTVCHARVLSPPAPPIVLLCRAIRPRLSRRSRQSYCPLTPPLLQPGPLHFLLIPRSSSPFSLTSFPISLYFGATKLPGHPSQFPPNRAPSSCNTRFLQIIKFCRISSALGCILNK
jgi:hypothetical protein